MPDYSREERRKLPAKIGKCYTGASNEAGKAKLEIYNSEQGRTFQIVGEAITATGQRVSFTGTVGE